MKFWASQQPHKHTHWLLSQEKVTLWCAIGKGGIFGPYFWRQWWELCDCQHRAVHQDDAKKVCSCIEKKERHWFGHYGVPARWGTTSLLKQNSWIPQAVLPRGQTHCASNQLPLATLFPRSQPTDYFLWGYLKDGVYENNPETTEVLKDNIRREIRQIPEEMLNTVVGIVIFELLLSYSSVGPGLNLLLITEKA